MPVTFQPPPQIPYGAPATSVGPGNAPALSQASPLQGASQALLGGGGGGGGPGADPGNTALMQALIAQRMKAKMPQPAMGAPGTNYSPAAGAQPPGMRLINSVSGLPNFDQSQGAPQPAPQQ